MRHIFCIAVTALALAGCAGTNFSWDNARQIRGGMAEAEVVKLMGSPTATRATAEGVTHAWVYVDSFRGTKTVAVTFRDGRVVQAPAIPDSFK